MWWHMVAPGGTWRCDRMAMRSHGEVEFTWRCEGSAGTGGRPARINSIFVFRFSLASNFKN
jgi:hypothetical protein